MFGLCRSTDEAGQYTAVCPGEQYGSLTGQVDFADLYLKMNIGLALYEDTYSCLKDQKTR